MHSGAALVLAASHVNLKTRKKPGAKGHVVHDSLYMERPERAGPQRQRPGRFRISRLKHKNVPKLTCRCPGANMHRATEAAYRGACKMWSSSECR